jgi:hypothetical protein
MATTQNTYTGNGSTTNYSFTFEYLDQSDVKAELVRKHLRQHFSQVQLLKQKI